MSLHVGIAQVPRHLALDLAFQLAHAAAQPAQLGAGVVAHLARRRDHRGERAGEPAQIGQGRGELGEPGRLLGVPGERRAHPRRGLERGEDLRQLASAERAPAGEFREQRAQVGHAAERRLGARVDQASRLAGVRQPFPDTGVCRGEVELADRPGAALGGGLGGGELEQPRPLEPCQSGCARPERHETGL